MFIKEYRHGFKTLYFVTQVKGDKYFNALFRFDSLNRQMFFRLFEKILPVFQKELSDVYMNNLAWMKALRKDPIHKKIMATRDDYVNNDMFDQDEAIAAAVDKRKFLLKRLLEDQRRFPEQ